MTLNFSIPRKYDNNQFIDECARNNLAKDIIMELQNDGIFFWDVEYIDNLIVYLLWKMFDSKYL